MKIERVMGNSDWRREWTKTRLQCAFANASVHKTIVLNLEGIQRIVNSHEKKFRFERLRCMDKSSKEVVQEAWDRSKQCGATLPDLLDNCGVGILRKWSLVSSEVLPEHA